MPSGDWSWVPFLEWRVGLLAGLLLGIDDGSPGRALGVLEQGGTLERIWFVWGGDGSLSRQHGTTFGVLMSNHRTFLVEGCGLLALGDHGPSVYGVPFVSRELWFRHATLTFFDLVLEAWYFDVSTGH